MNVFVGGSKTITKLKDEAISAIDEFCEADAHILIGDCFGADKLVQQYLYDKGYTNVTVYVSGCKIRNNVGSFPVKYIDCGDLKGYEFYQQKDIAMADDADVGLMLWDGKTRGTKQNIIYLKDNGKNVRIIRYSQEEYQKKRIEIKHRDNKVIKPNIVPVSADELFDGIRRIVLIKDASVFGNDDPDSYDIEVEELYRKLPKGQIRRIPPNEIERTLCFPMLARLYDVAPEKLSPFQRGLIKYNRACKWRVLCDHREKLLRCMKQCVNIVTDFEPDNEVRKRFNITQQSVAEAISGLKVSDLKYCPRKHSYFRNKEYYLDYPIVAYPRNTFIDNQTNEKVTLKMYINPDYLLSLSNGKTIVFISFHLDDRESKNSKGEKVKIIR